MHIVPGDHEHPASPPQDSLWWRIAIGPWLAPILLVAGWAPLFVADIILDILQQRGVVGPHDGVGFGMGWGLGIAFPLTIVACASIIFHSIRAVYRYFLRR
jgi:hypothetical protein